MKASLEILQAGLMTSVQDMGREGLAYFAVPKSGVMDKNAAKIALLLLNQAENNPLIECTSLPPKIRFNTATKIALTGADFGWKVNEKEVPLNTVLEIKEGDILKGRFAQTGFRGYIAVAGKLEVEEVYNSHSTYTNAKIGGVKGRLLQNGDTISWKSEIYYSSDYQVIKIQKGPEFDYLNENAKEELTKNIYQVSPDSNRMGARLKGTRLESKSYQLEYSLPVLPGFIQLPPSGLPIVVLQDGQVSGGYPRIAYIQERYLSVFNQIPLSGRFRFEWENSK
jgi:antagonist of KipI